MNPLKIIAILLALFILISCSSDPDSIEWDIVDADLIKYGIVENGCGPTDALVVRIILTDEEFSCSQSHEDVKNISSYLEVTDVIDIEVGMVIRGHAYRPDAVPDPAYECEKSFEDCVAVGVITIEILYDDGVRLKGNWSLEGNDRTGQFNVIKCYDPHPPCG